MFPFDFAFGLWGGRVAESGTIKPERLSQSGERIGRGKFREDLFHRLNVVCLQLPPCANAARIFQCWCSTFSVNTPATSALKLRRSLPMPCPCYKLTPGLATFASWKT